MTELFVTAVWAASFLTVAARIAFHTQTIRIQPVMRKIRQGLMPATLVALQLTMGFAASSEAHSMPGPKAAGTVVVERTLTASLRDGISLDEAVSRAERQYNARVVRTDVQDEDGRKVYVLKLLREDGRVFTVRVDAQTGRSR
jgi:hypothetical protein